MDEELKAGIRGLGRLMRQGDTKAVLKSIGWHADMPLVVAVRDEMMGSVIDRASGADSIVVLVFHAENNTYTVAGFDRSHAGEGDATDFGAIDVDASTRNLPVAGLEDNVLGKPDPFRSYRPTMRPQVLQLI